MHCYHALSLALARLSYKIRLFTENKILAVNGHTIPLTIHDTGQAYDCTMLSLYRPNVQQSTGYLHAISSQYQYLTASRMNV